MEEMNPKKERMPEILMPEWCTHRQEELISADVLKILRMRAARSGSNGGSNPIG